MEWQPIESAPRDGEFLAYDVDSCKFDVCYMWEITKGEWVPWPTQIDGEYGPSVGDFGRDNENIKFWRPLPEPPK